MGSCQTIWPCSVERRNRRKDKWISPTKTSHYESSFEAPIRRGWSYAEHIGERQLTEMRKGLVWLFAELVIADQETDAAKFRRLANEWQKETAAISSVQAIVLHPAYQKIMAMGPVAIPYILREMKREPNHWFWALNMLTDGESPAEGSTTITEATDRWLKWGESRGYLLEEGQ